MNMSKNKAVGLLSAALRHLRDAEHLADTMNPYRSLDQAYHLAGFGPECARKAAIAAPWMNKLLGHELGDNAEDFLEMAAMLEPSAWHDDLRNWEDSYPTLASWNPESRYEPTPTYDRKKVDSLLRESWLVVSEILAFLWADGRFSWKDVV